MVDTLVPKPTTGDLTMDGEGLKDTLMVFNQNQLQTSTAMGGGDHANSATEKFKVVTDAAPAISAAFCGLLCFSV